MAASCSQAAVPGADPGVPPAGYQGIDRVLGTVDGLKKLVAIQDSPYHGLNLCLGSVAEMLQEPDREIHDVIRFFGQRQKIFNIHFRNICGRRDDFCEVFPDNGDMNMLRTWSCPPTCPGHDRQFANAAVPQAQGFFRDIQPSLPLIQLGQHSVLGVQIGLNLRKNRPFFGAKSPFWAPNRPLSGHFGGLAQPKSCHGLGGMVSLHGFIARFIALQRV